MEGDTKKTQTGYANFFRPPTVEDGFQRLGLSSAAGGLVGFALSGSITGTAEGALGGGALYGTGLAGTFAYDQVFAPGGWENSYSANFFGGEGTALEIALNPFHGGIAGHTAYYGSKKIMDWTNTDAGSLGRWWNHIIGNKPKTDPKKEGYETTFYHGLWEKYDPVKYPHYSDTIWSGLAKDKPITRPAWGTRN